MGRPTFASNNFGGSIFMNPYCIAKYEKSERAIVCYEKSESGARRLTGADRMNKKECIDCPQLTEAVDMLMKHREENWK